ncbi:MAG: HD-GYP domain-containing protein [Gammaproteobacteria bacterium]|nr:HD-GYP domain-containing protein [Gammaproteobacteria bacterium]
MKMKISVSDIKIGMYIDELDRPWIGSPFMFQGFLLSEAEHLEQLVQLCEFVFVDPEKSTVSVSNNLHLLKSPESDISAKLFVDTVIIAPQEMGSSDLEKELLKAKKMHDQTRQYIRHVLKDIYHGVVPDIDKAKELVSELVTNIVNSPDMLVLLTQLKDRDEYTAIHSMNVCVLSIAFGRYLCLPLDKLRALGLAALLHDVGKMKVARHILQKPGKLSKEEMSLMKAHAFLGYELLKDEKGMTEEILAVIKDHHERIDGSGYPLGLKGEKLTSLTKIVSLVDVYDALTSDRVYKDAMTQTNALHQLYNMAKNNFEHEFIESFIKCIGIYPVGSIVEMNTGHVGVVVKLNDDHKLKPVVGLILSRKKELYDKIKLLNMASDIWQKSSGVKIKIDKVLEAGAYDLDVHSIINKVLAGG